jgi:hypothetical protein
MYLVHSNNFYKQNVFEVPKNSVKRRRCTWCTAANRSVVFSYLYVLQYGCSMRCKPADSQSWATVRF